MNWEFIKRNQKYIRIWLVMLLAFLITSWFSYDHAFLLPVFAACSKFLVRWWVHRNGLQSVISGVISTLGITAYFYWSDRKYWKDHKPQPKKPVSPIVPAKPDDVVKLVAQQASTDKWIAEQSEVQQMAARGKR